MSSDTVMWSDSDSVTPQGFNSEDGTMTVIQMSIHSEQTDHTFPDNISEPPAAEPYPLAQPEPSAPITEPSAAQPEPLLHNPQPSSSQPQQDSSALLKTPDQSPTKPTPPATALRKPRTSVHLEETDFHSNSNSDAESVHHFAGFEGNPHENEAQEAGESLPQQPPFVNPPQQFQNPLPTDLRLSYLPIKKPSEYNLDSWSLSILPGHLTSFLRDITTATLAHHNLAIQDHKDFGENTYVSTGGCAIRMPPGFKRQILDILCNHLDIIAHMAKNPQVLTVGSPSCTLQMLQFAFVMAHIPTLRLCAYGINSPTHFLETNIGSGVPHAFQHQNHFDISTIAHAIKATSQKDMKCAPTTCATASWIGN
ncbi:hypothetical protein PtA15_5A722 [Puccinia triticina]|uniref:Uncharacterized protein n=1 Tax=Puccinia triticina TaxID=208348 RepID=A0ABY7CIV6_9BASI|nr:uncharacterized protein PtA15_5A722 [Puccinia triticina]WAQ85148.1 hypothetical protein PtA15_5A722 [Puccinia triticina]